MITFLLFTVMLAFWVYSFTSIIKTDYKRELQHRLMKNHIKMKKLYMKIEELIFLKGYRNALIDGKKMSYDFYLTAIKEHNAIFDREMDELRSAKFNPDTEKYYLQLIRSHEHELDTLQSEVSRVEHNYFIQRRNIK